MTDTLMVRLAVILVSLLVILFTWTAAYLTGWCLWAISVSLLVTCLLGGVVYVAVRW